MKNLFKDKIWGIGFSISMILYICSHFVAYLWMFEFVTKCSSCGADFGFPATFYHTEIAKCGMPDNMFSCKLAHFSISGAFIDLLFAIIFSFIVGLIFKFIWAKLQSNPLK